MSKTSSSGYFFPRSSGLYSVPEVLILNVSAPVRRVARLKVDDEEERIALVATKAEWSVERRFMWERISDRSHESSRRAGWRWNGTKGWVGNDDIARQFSGFSAPAATSYY